MRSFVVCCFLMILAACSANPVAVKTSEDCNAACVAKKKQGIQHKKRRCHQGISEAWERLDVMKAQGFSGTLSYTKAFGLITAAKTQESLERFDSCIDKVVKAKYYISESEKGR